MVAIQFIILFLVPIALASQSTANDPCGNEKKTAVIIILCLLLALACCVPMVYICFKHQYPMKIFRARHEYYGAI